MYRKILVAADPEGLASDATPAVADLATPGDAEVLVVTVEDRSGQRASADDARLQALVEELGRHGLTAHVERRTLTQGHVADEIARAVEEFGADLVVLGSHRHGEIGGFFAGSVGRALASRITTPILVVGSGAGRPAPEVRRILVAVDGGERALRAVTTAGQIAGPHTEVHLLYIDTPPGGFAGYAAYADPTPAQEAGDDALKDAVAALKDAGVETRTQRLYAPEGVGDEISRYAEEIDADLIVLGSSRPGRLQALLVGSVAHDVIARTRRMVLLATSGGPTEPAPQNVAHTA